MSRHNVALAALTVTVAGAALTPDADATRRCGGESIGPELCFEVPATNWNNVSFDISREVNVWTTDQNESVTALVRTYKLKSGTVTEYGGQILKEFSPKFVTMPKAGDSGFPLYLNRPVSVSLCRDGEPGTACAEARDQSWTLGATFAYPAYRGGQYVTQYVNLTTAGTTIDISK